VNREAAERSERNKRSRSLRPGGLLLDQREVTLIRAGPRDASRRTRKYAIYWKDGPSIKEYAKALDHPSVRRILDEPCFSHPTTELRIFVVKLPFWQNAK
jgi:hypothetical protein